jgi:hypothetical protein
MTGILVGVKTHPISESCGFIEATINRDGKIIQVFIDRRGIRNPDSWEKWRGFEVEVVDCIELPTGHQLAPGNVASGLLVIDPVNEQARLSQLYLAV